MTDIKDIIKQKSFTSVFQEAAINLMYTQIYYDRKMKLALKEFNVSPQQYNVLRILRGASPGKVSAGYINERMLDKDSNTTRLIDKLILKDFVVRDLCPSNRRRMDIAITKDGLAILKTMDKKITFLENEFMKLTEKEAVQLNKLLNKIRE